jgi:2-dehydropantoate 2-reductase
MKIVILGAGVIGCYLGAALNAGGLAPTLIARPRVIADIKQAGGLTISDYQERQWQVGIPDMSASNESLADADLVLLTVKCLAVEESAKLLQQYCKAGTIVLCLQNGLGSDAIIKRLCPTLKIVRGIVGFNVALLGDGHFHRGMEGDIYHEPNPTITTALTSAFAAIDMTLLSVKNYEAIAWAKLQLNLNNAINALSNLPLKTELEHRGYRRILSAAMTELLVVTKANHLALPKLTHLPASWLPKVMKVPDWVYRKLSARMQEIDSQARSSMWDDLHLGRLTEVEYLNGAVVKAASKLGIDTPVNTALCTLIHQVEQHRRHEGLSAADIEKAIKKEKKKIEQKKGR